MDPATITAIAGLIKTAVELGPVVIKGIDDAKPFAEAAINFILGGQVTQERLDELEAKRQALSAQLQALQPPADDA